MNEARSIRPAIACFVALVVIGCTKKQVPAPVAPTPPPSGAGGGLTATPGGGSGKYTVAAADASSLGALSVSATFKGESIPGRVEVPVNINVEVCEHKVFDEALLVDAESRGLANLVVEIEGVASGPKKPPETITVSNKDCSFSPHVGVATVGTKIQLVNEDPILHTTHPYLNGSHLFNVSLPNQSAKPPPRPIPKAGLLEFTCDVHKWMKAWVVVGSNPYLGATDAKGALTIDEIPPGTYKYKIWHEKLGDQPGMLQFTAGAKSGEVTIEAGKTAELSFELSVREL